MTHPILKKALDVWGEKAQMLMVVEEMSELIKEILKNVNRSKNNIDEIAEETADVEIMLEQLKENYRIAEKVKTYNIPAFDFIDSFATWEHTFSSVLKLIK